MANLDRGAWRQSDDIHSAGADHRADEDEGSRLPLLVAIALIVLAAFGGVVWLAYTQGVERGREDAPRLITAQPAKAPPSAASPYAGLSIYQKPSAADEDTANASSVPPPPPPLSAMRASNPPPALRPSASGSEISQPKLGTARSFPAQKAPTKPAQNLAAVEPSTVTAAATGPASVPAPATAVGGVLLQIGSFKSDAEARQSWTNFARRHAMAAAYQPDVKRVDLGAKGVWYRLRLAGFADREAAAALCEKLRADGAGCILAK